MTDRLAEIKVPWTRSKFCVRAKWELQKRDVDWLIQEVERLRKENASMDRILEHKEDTIIDYADKIESLGGELPEYDELANKETSP